MIEKLNNISIGLKDDFGISSGGIEIVIAISLVISMIIAGFCSFVVPNNMNVA